MTLISRARIGGKIGLEFAWLAVKFLGVRRSIPLNRDIWPRRRKLKIKLKPFLQPWLGIRLDCLGRAFWLADPAIDALIGVDDQHVFTLVEAIHGADFDAVHVFAFDAIVVDDIGHIHTLNGLFARLAPIAWVMRAQVWRAAAGTSGQILI